MKFLGFVVVAIASIPRACTFQSGSRPTIGADPIRLFSFVSVEENTLRDIPALDNWATACGVQRSNGFQLASQDGIDVSVVTNEDLPANSPVLYIPSEMILSSDRAVQELGRVETAEKILSSLNASFQLRHFYLMLKILVEWERGEDSPWFPWLNSLPRYFSNGASMTPFCFECLPPLVASLAMKERASLKHLSNINSVRFLSQETKDNEALLKWAFQIVSTRGFESNDGSEDLRIAPMADMLNHGTDPEVAVGYDEAGNCYAQTIRDVPAGSPLRMSYGDPTNPSYLLARYGFLDESSPATFCKIMLPQQNSQLKNMGYEHSRMLFYKDTGDVSQEVWDVLLYQVLGETNVPARRQLYEAHMSGDQITKQQLHEQYYPQTSARLLAHIDKFLGKLEKLLAKGNGVPYNDHPRLPLILRHNEFVKNTFLAVRARYFG